MHLKFHSASQLCTTHIFHRVYTNHQELIKSRKRLSENEVRYYALQILDALEYLHKNRVIHRDLKLGNLFLANGLRVKMG